MFARWPYLCLLKLHRSHRLYFLTLGCLESAGPRQMWRFARGNVTYITAKAASTN
jgi:hypothetical protein